MVPSGRILCDPEAAKRAFATLDRPVPGLPGGSPLGILAHWWSMGDLTQTEGLGPDGHPPRAPGLPTIDEFPVRMFAGTSVERLRPLRTGEWADVHATAVETKRTETRTGRPIAFIEERYELHADDDVVLRERRTVAYTVPAPPTERRPGDVDTTWRRIVVPDERMLFRFSAITWNAHRIHYDRRFATEVDGHPDLVVHGPLLAALAADLWEHEDPRPLRAFSFRAMAPVYVGESVAIVGGPDGSLAAVDEDGRLLMTATAEPAEGGTPWTSS